MLLPNEAAVNPANTDMQINPFSAVCLRSLHRFIELSLTLIRSEGLGDDTLFVRRFRGFLLINDLTLARGALSLAAEVAAPYC